MLNLNGVERPDEFTTPIPITGIPTIIHATFKSPSAATGIFHAFGYYEAPAAHKAFTNAAATQTLGTALNTYQGHVFIVAGGAGTASGGTNGVGKITITGTSVTSGGVRNANDTEILVADTSALAANSYVESTKMWSGQVTLTLGQTGDRTTYALNANYGFASAMHFFERNVTINQFEVTGRGGVSDTGFNIQLLKHSPAGWTYSAAAFVAGGSQIVGMLTDIGDNERRIASGIRFHYHRKGLTTSIAGATGEGIVARITTTANNAIESMDLRVQFAWA